MIVLGCDPSSSSAGFAEVTDGELTDQAVWTPPKKATRYAALVDYEDSLAEWIGDRKIDLAVVAQVYRARARSHDAVRVLSHFESPTYIVLERRGIPIVEMKDSTARNWVLELPITASKEEAHAEIRKRYPDLKLPPVNRGGGDVADGYILALAGPISLRRK